MSTIKIKRSGTSSQTPETLEHGELALNYADGKLFYKDATNAIAEIGGAGGGLDSAAIGGVEVLSYKTRLITNEDRFAIGQNANINNNGEGNIAIGFNAAANGDDGAVSLGKSTSAGGYQGIAIGVSAKADENYSISMGVRAGANGGTESGILIGYQCGLYMSNSPSEEGNVFLGGGAGAHSSLLQAANFFNRTVAIGYSAATKTTGETADAIAIGYRAGQQEMGSNSINIGRDAGRINAGDNSITINATGLEVNNTDQYAIDIRTSDSGSVTYSTDSDWVFGAAVTAPAFVGDGSGLTNLPSGGGGLDSAAVIATMNEEFKILTGSRVEIGNGAVTSGGGGTDFFNIAIGSSASAIGDAGVAIGRLSNIPNNVVNAVAVGIDTEVSANYGVAVGDGASVTGTESTAIGPESGATGNASLALGRGAKANANNTIALAATGANSTVATQYGIDIRTSAAGSLTYDTTDDWKFGAQVSAPELTVDAATSDWKFSVSGDDLIISFGGTSKAKLDTAGNLTVVGDVTAFGTI